MENEAIVPRALLLKWQSFSSFWIYRVLLDPIVKTLRFRRRLIFLLGLLVLALTVPPILEIYKKNESACNLHFFQNALVSIKQFLRGTEFYSQKDQDRWILTCAFPHVRNGYFVDVGSGDGVFMSNTNALEKIGWNGICVDPFPSNMKGRSCLLLKEVVSDVPGQTVRFRKAGFLGGIEEDIGRWKDHETVRQSDVQEFQTTSLTQILLKAKAPRFIHYVSIDIEGAELDALKGLDFSKYQVGAFTIEHNFEEPKRTQIRQLLESKGYRFARSSAQDDYYLLAEPRRN